MLSIVIMNAFNVGLNIVKFAILITLIHAHSAFQDITSTITNALSAIQHAKTVITQQHNVLHVNQVRTLQLQIHPSTYINIILI